MDKKLMTVEEVAALLHVKKSTIYQLVFYHRIPAIHVSNRCLRFDPDAIREWLKQKSTDTTSPRFRPSPTPKTGRPRGRPRKDTIDAIVNAAKREVLGT
jgi:excisionase family DNA binding protein